MASSNTVQVPPPGSWGEVVKKRRDELGITQEELALRADVSPSLVTKIERGAHPLAKLGVGNLAKLLNALEWSPEHLREKVTMDLPLSSPRFEPEGYKIAPVVGCAEAGRPNDYPVPAQLHRPGMAVFQVQGDSMSTGDPDSLRDGDWVFVDRNLINLADGKLYVIEIVGDGYTVKRARKLNGSWFLVSDNPRHGSFRVSEAYIVGEVFDAVGKRNV